MKTTKERKWILKRKGSFVKYAVKSAASLLSPAHLLHHDVRNKAAEVDAGFKDVISTVRVLMRVGSIIYRGSYRTPDSNILAGYTLENCYVIILLLGFY